MVQQINGLLIAVIPKKAFETWLRETMKFFEITPPDDAAFKHLEEESLVYLIPVLEDFQACMNYIKDHYLELFRNSLTLWCKEEKCWPKDLTYERFNEFFTIELHTHIYNMSAT